jgi:hypothetical protein
VLKAVFLSRENELNSIFADWLSTQTDLRAVMWRVGRYSWAWRARWLRRSLKREGLIGTLDRILFRLWLLRSREISDGWKQLVSDVRDACPAVGHAASVPKINVSSVNAPEGVALLRSLEPDVVIVNCMSQILSDEVLSVPRLGTFIYHECFTPEYRGAHTIFWALANGDHDKIGYTLLKANSRIDGGEVYAQGPTALDPLATPLGYIGHWALFEGLPDIARVLRELEAGTARPIDITGRQGHYYNHFPYSRLRQILQRRSERNLPLQIAQAAKRSTSDALQLLIAGLSTELFCLAESEWLDQLGADGVLGSFGL